MVLLVTVPEVELRVKEHLIVTTTKATESHGTTWLSPYPLTYKREHAPCIRAGSAQTLPERATDEGGGRPPTG